MKQKQSKEKEKNKSLSVDLLESYRKALYKIKEYFDMIVDREFDINNIDESMKIVKSVLEAGDKLGKNIESLMVLEKRVQAEEDLKGKARGNVKLGMFEDV